MFNGETTMILVTIKNEILGDGLFWKGEDNEIDNIRNIPARIMASKTAKDKKKGRLECGG